MTRVTKWVMLGTGMVMGLALAFAIAMGSSATFAQSLPAAQDGAAGVMAAPLGHRGGGFRGVGGDKYDEFLADELGITLEELRAAQDAAQSRAIEQAVTDGTLTQEQADAMQAQRALQTYLDKDAIIAEALGMSVEEYQAAEASGQRLPEIIESQGLDAATVQDAIQKGYEAAVQEAVSDGVVTQEQADEFLSGGRGGLGGRRGPGGPGSLRGPRQAPSDSTILPDTGL